MKVDSREPKHIVRYFRKKGWTVDHAKFADAGDIADSDLQIIIERKGGPDLVASIFDGRLLDQCERLFALCERLEALGYVVIYGDLSDSVKTHERYIKKGLRKQGKRVPRNFSLNINQANIYKKISMLPWHYDVNVLWFLTEEEALECIHYMIQEVSVSDPFTKTFNKRRRSKAKRKKKEKSGVKRTKKTRVVHSSNAKRDDKLAKAPKGETEKQKFRRLGLI